MNHISANIICKNEQDNIKACIESVLPFVDEVVIVDTGSTDETINIIQSLESDKIKLLHKEWNDNFADMRNYAIENSEGEYIFIIDADMTLLNFDVKPELDFYTGDVTILTASGIVAFPMIFLFKREFRYSGQRHATIENSLHDKKGEHSNIIVSHPQLSRQEIETKLKHNLDIHLNQLKEEPDNPAVIYHLFRTYYYFKEWDNAIKYGIDVLNSSLNTQTKATTGLFLYLCYIGKGLKEVGIPYLNYSLELIPVQSMGRYLMFDLFCEFGNAELAGDTLSELIFFSQRKKSDLACDYFLNQEQINELKLKIKEIK